MSRVRAPSSTPSSSLRSSGLTARWRRAAPVPWLGGGAATTYDGLARDVRAGDSLLLDDGAVRLEVLDSDGRRVRCRVIEGGTISDHKGINLPGVRVRAPALTPKDIDDLRFALSLGVD